MAGAAALALFVVGAATAPAGRFVATATTDLTSILTTTTAETTTLPTTTTAPATTTEPATTAPTSTEVPTTTSSAPTTPPVGPVSAVRQRPLRIGCPVATVVLLIPRRGPLVVGPFADAKTRRAGIAQLVYRANGGIVTGSAASVSEHTCSSRGPSGANAVVSSLSLFDGAVTADRVAMAHGSPTVTGLAVNGTETTPRPRIVVPDLGVLTIGGAARLPVAASALALRLTSPRNGLPAGTVVLVAAVGSSATPPTKQASGHPQIKKSRKHKAVAKHKKRAKHAAKGGPLTVTPRLGQRHYVFPVAGHSDYGDSYGGLRTDVLGHWHHGDDIFAALGTPVVAVADGTINRVGWERLGGWRLWVRDNAGDQFYYAHLSGYAPLDLQSNRVRAGQVIGFVGNTGDAFTTSPHLHFEIHPRPLLHLHYNGAVDPTTYLDQWAHLDHVVAPKPTHPGFPTAPQLRSEARYVFRELLEARHIVKHRPSPKLRPHVRVHAADGVAPPTTRHTSAATRAAPTTSGGASSSTGLIVFGVLVALLSGAGWAFVVLRNRAI
jgi:murein DD-endopeptidase MepM/ murein hydrolase activator NlpD